MTINVFFFLNFQTGGSLQEHIDQYKRLNVNMALQYFRQILQALVYLQQKYVLHEDIKADNILLRANSLDLVLVDFGLSRQLPPDNPFVSAGIYATLRHTLLENIQTTTHGALDQIRAKKRANLKCRKTYLQTTPNCLIKLIRQVECPFPSICSVITHKYQ